MFLITNAAQVNDKLVALPLKYNSTHLRRAWQGGEVKDGPGDVDPGEDLPLPLTYNSTHLRRAWQGGGGEGWPR